MRALLVFSLFVMLAAAAPAQEAAPEANGEVTTEQTEEAAPEAAPQATPEGDWQDEYGTTLRLSFCGDGTQLCAVLLDVQGESRTEGNLAYVNQQVMQADMTGPNEWSGTVIFDGSEAKSTLNQTGPDTIEIEGCRAAILCDTLTFNRL